MQTVEQLSHATKADLVARLKTIEGQARGIAQMLADNRDCQPVMDQFLALRAAAQSVAVEALTAFGTQCMSAEKDRDEALAQIFAMVARLAR